MPRLGTERAGEHRGRDRAGQCRGDSRAPTRPRPKKPRRAVMNTIEKESLDKTGLRSDVVTLYQGGLYHLYRYKKYTDVRLVFAPEQDIAFFGGDPDNFEYPRYDLDICFFRVYEDGKPAKIDALSEVEPGRPEGRRAGVRVRQSRQDRPAEHRRAPGVSPRPGVARPAQPCCGAAKCCLRSSASGARRTPAGPRTICSAYQNSPQGPPGRAGRPARPGRDGPHKAAEAKFRQAVMKDPQLQDSRAATPGTR